MLRTDEHQCNNTSLCDSIPATKAITVEPYHEATPEFNPDRGTQMAQSLAHKG
ncbi:hypothetical protein TIFTF001_030565 [Ficus carica]|uniref:Uncharacterized protein n=1 Tax=Ficus carica TaxID=3494 RepID=A0AA88IZW6_FICCA|nr:hypothetical protein TIFTF001_030565 [Ficus carica]